MLKETRCSHSTFNIKHSTFLVVQISVPSRLWIALDCSMLVAVVALQAWRLTGVPLHEWLAVALIAGIVAHLLQHWNWIESRGRRLRRPGSARTRVNYALNASLFTAMAIAMISGF